jgi:hypothetical protein
VAILAPRLGTVVFVVRRGSRYAPRSKQTSVAGTLVKAILRRSRKVVRSRKALSSWSVKAKAFSLKVGILLKADLEFKSVFVLLQHARKHIAHAAAEGNNSTSAGVGKPAGPQQSGW